MHDKVKLSKNKEERMEKEIKIEKMVLNIDGEKVSLTMEQAKKLKGILDELFGKEIVKEVIHHHDNWYYWRPYYWNTFQGSTGGTGNTTYMQNAVQCSNNTLGVTL